MGSEQRFAPQARVVVNEFRNRAGDGQSIVCTGSPAYLIEDNKRTRRGVMEYSRRFQHLHHESGLSNRKVVLKADASENAVHKPDSRRVCGHVTSYLRHQRNDSHLPYIS